MINQEKQDRKKQKTSKGTDGGKKKKSPQVWHLAQYKQSQVWYLAQYTEDRV